MQNPALDFHFGAGMAISALDFRNSALDSTKSGADFTNFGAGFGNFGTGFQKFGAGFQNPALELNSAPDLEFQRRNSWISAPEVCPYVGTTKALRVLDLNRILPILQTYQGGSGRAGDPPCPGLYICRI